MVPPITYSHISLEGCSTFNCCKCTIFWIWIDHYTRKFSCLFHNYTMRPLALLGPFTDHNDRFPTPFKYFKYWSPYLFIFLKPEKKFPFPMGRPRMGQNREYTSGEKAIATRNIIPKVYRDDKWTSLVLIKNTMASAEKGSHFRRSLACVAGAKRGGGVG